MPNTPLKPDNSNEPQSLRKAGLKVTSPRLRVLSVLEHSANKHISAEDVYRTLLNNGESVSLATIYRVLTQFEATGLAIRHNFSDGHAVYELAGEHHDHIVCLDCGDIVEFVDSVIEQRQRRVAREHQFELHDHALVIYGRCWRPNCPNREDN